MNFKIQLIVFILLFFFTGLFSQSQDQNSIDIDSLSRRFKLEVSYNDLAGDIILFDKRIQLKIVPGLSQFEINHKVHSLPRPISMVNGQVFVDRKILEHLSNKEQVVPPKIEKKVTHELPKDFIVVIDPGHGGKDPGTSGEKGTEEKKVVLTIGLLLKEELENMGATVILTRTRDEFIPLPERPLIASMAGANVFISLHLNSTKDSQIEGVEIFVYRYRDQEYENSRATSVAQNISIKKSLLADDCYISMGIDSNLMRLQQFSSIQESHFLASRILSKILEKDEMTNRGIKEANFVVLRNATCPSVLIEMGFLSNEETEGKFQTSSYCKSMAKNIAAGIAKFWKEK